MTANSSIEQGETSLETLLSTDHLNDFLEEFVFTNILDNEFNNRYRNQEKNKRKLLISKLYCDREDLLGTYISASCAVTYSKESDIKEYLKNQIDDNPKRYSMVSIDALILYQEQCDSIELREKIQEVKEAIHDANKSLGWPDVSYYICLSCGNRKYLKLSLLYIDQIIFQCFKNKNYELLISIPILLDYSLDEKMDFFLDTENFREMLETFLNLFTENVIYMRESDREFTLKVFIAILNIREIYRANLSSKQTRRLLNLAFISISNDICYWEFSLPKYLKRFRKGCFEKILDPKLNEFGLYCEILRNNRSNFEVKSRIDDNVIFPIEFIQKLEKMLQKLKRFACFQPFKYLFGIIIPNFETKSIYEKLKAITFDKGLHNKCMAENISLLMLSTYISIHNRICHYSLEDLKMISRFYVDNSLNNESTNCESVRNFLIVEIFDQMRNADKNLIYSFVIKFVEDDQIKVKYDECYDFIVSLLNLNNVDAIERSFCHRWHLSIEKQFIVHVCQYSEKKNNYMTDAACEINKVIEIATKLLAENCNCDFAAAYLDTMLLMFKNRIENHKENVEDYAFIFFRKFLNHIIPLMRLCKHICQAMERFFDYFSNDNNRLKEEFLREITYSSLLNKSKFRLLNYFSPSMWKSAANKNESVVVFDRDFKSILKFSSSRNIFDYSEIILILRFPECSKLWEKSYLERLVEFSIEILEQSSLQIQYRWDSIMKCLAISPQKINPELFNNCLKMCLKHLMYQINRPRLLNEPFIIRATIDLLSLTNSDCALEENIYGMKEVLYCIERNKRMMDYANEFDNKKFTIMRILRAKSFGLSTSTSDLILSNKFWTSDMENIMRSNAHRDWNSYYLQQLFIYSIILICRIEFEDIAEMQANDTMRYNDIIVIFEEASHIFSYIILNHSGLIVPGHIKQLINFYSKRSIRVHKFLAFQYICRLFSSPFCDPNMLHLIHPLFLELNDQDKSEMSNETLMRLYDSIKYLFTSNIEYDASLFNILESIFHKSFGDCVYEDERKDLTMGKLLIIEKMVDSSNECFFDLFIRFCITSIEADYTHYESKVKIKRILETCQSRNPTKEGKSRLNRLSKYWEDERLLNIETIMHKSLDDMSQFITTRESISLALVNTSNTKENVLTWHKVDEKLDRIAKNCLYYDDSRFSHEFCSLINLLLSVNVVFLSCSELILELSSILYSELARIAFVMAYKESVGRVRKYLIKFLILVLSQVKDVSMHEVVSKILQDLLLHESIKIIEADDLIKLRAEKELRKFPSIYSNRISDNLCLFVDKLRSFSLSVCSSENRIIEMSEDAHENALLIFIQGHLKMHCELLGLNLPVIISAQEEENIDEDFSDDLNEIKVKLHKQIEFEKIYGSHIIDLLEIFFTNLKVIKSHDFTCENKRYYLMRKTLETIPSLAKTEPILATLMTLILDEKLEFNNHRDLKLKLMNILYFDNQIYTLKLLFEDNKNGIYRSESSNSLRLSIKSNIEKYKSEAKEKYELDRERDPNTLVQFQDSGNFDEIFTLKWKTTCKLMAKILNISNERPSTSDDALVDRIFKEFSMEQWGRAIPFLFSILKTEDIDFIAKIILKLSTSFFTNITLRLFQANSIDDCYRYHIENIMEKVKRGNPDKFQLLKLFYEDAMKIAIDVCKIYKDCLQKINLLVEDEKMISKEMIQHLERQRDNIKKILDIENPVEREECFIDQFRTSSEELSMSTTRVIHLLNVNLNKVQNIHGLRGNPEIKSLREKIREESERVDVFMDQTKKMRLDFYTHYLTTNVASQIPIISEGNSKLDFSHQVRIAPRNPIIGLKHTRASPIELKLEGSDEREYNYYIKSYSVKKEQNVMEIFKFFNLLFEKDFYLRTNNCKIKTYDIYSLTKKAGLIVGYESCMSLGQFIKEGRVRLIPATRKKALSFDLRDLPQFQQEAILLNENSSQGNEDLNEIIEISSLDLNDLDKRKRNFANSLALMSIVGYIIGLEDRHSTNILVEVETMNIFHIDLEDSFSFFDSEGNLKSIVPFRISPQIKFALKSHMGVFRETCIRVLDLLTQNRDAIIRFISAILSDHYCTRSSIINENGTICDNLNKAVRNCLQEKEGRRSINKKILDHIGDLLSSSETIEDQVDGLIVDSTSLELNAGMYHGFDAFN
ncbi:MAG: hypothetical protein MHMPM18_000505 [Marteilia pararefringens]